MFNPYMTNTFPYPSNYSPSSTEIPHVNGRNGAEVFPIGRNSSVLLLDENAPIVYLVRTDSASYKTITPYTITECTPEPTVDMRSLLSRIETLERRFENESNLATDEPIKHESSNRTNQIINEYNPSERKPTGGNGKLFGNKSNN